MQKNLRTKALACLFIILLLLFTACSKGGDKEAATELAETPTSLPTSTAKAIPTSTAPWQIEPVGGVEAKPTPDLSGAISYIESAEHFSNVMTYRFNASAGCEYKEENEFSSLTEYNLYVTEQLVQKKEYLDDLIRKNKIRKDVLYVHLVLNEEPPFQNIRYDGVITDECVVANLLAAIGRMKYETKDIGDITDAPTLADTGSYMIICGYVDDEVIELFNTLTKLPSYGNKIFLGMSYTSDCSDIVERINVINTAVCDAAFAKFIEAYYLSTNYPVVLD